MSVPRFLFRALGAIALAGGLAGCGSGGSSPASMPAAQFGSPVVTDLGAAASVFVFADFDRDGKADALATADGNTLLYLHGNGDGSFQATHTLPGVVSPVDAVAVDLNRDGNLDFVILGCAAASCAPTERSAFVFLGNGAGAFAFPVAYGSGEWPSSLAIGDFNGDGNPDVAIGHATQVEAILLGNGDGTLRPAVMSPSRAQGAFSIAVADFNGDGRQDLVTFGGTLVAGAAVTPGLGDGTFGAPVVTQFGTIPSQVALLDVNRDGKVDVIVNGGRAGSQPAAGFVTIMLGGGDGTFSFGGSPLDYPNPSLGVTFAAGDIDRDGIPDIVTLGGLGELSLFYGKGDGTFLPRQAFPLTLSGSLAGNALVDLNGDGRLDLVVRNARGFAVLLNTR